MNVNEIKSYYQDNGKWKECEFLSGEEMTQRATELLRENERLNNIINEIKDNCNDKTKDEVYLKMSKEALVNIINQKRNCIGYLRIERDKCFNIINELEKWLEGNDTYKSYDHITTPYSLVLNKLKELKENKDE